MGHAPTVAGLACVHPTATAAGTLSCSQLHACMHLLPRMHMHTACGRSYRCPVMVLCQSLAISMSTWTAALHRSRSAFHDRQHTRQNRGRTWQTHGDACAGGGVESRQNPAPACYRGRICYISSAQLLPSTSTPRSPVHCDGLHRCMGVYDRHRGAGGETGRRGRRHAT